MPRRRVNLVNGEFYHIYSKSIDGKRIFGPSIFCERFYDLLYYYSQDISDLSYSRYLENVSEGLNDFRHPSKGSKNFNVEILCYCIMPTHFHLLIKQVKDDGIVNLISKTKNSFTKYFNKIHTRNGYLFMDRFNAIHIDNEEVLLHVSRYIHLNPYSSSLVKDINLLDQYKWSSYKSYVTNEEDRLINTEDILNIFEDNKDEYKKFVMDRGGYQKSLEAIKHLKAP